MDVTLHIYDVTNVGAVSVANKGLSLLGTGAFHGAVEVNGTEWSFGYIDEGTGVFNCSPKQCEMHKYRESIDMGKTGLSEQELNALIAKMSEEWPGDSYDLLRKNCCSFSDAFCVELGVGHIPKWVTNLAGAGATVLGGLEFTKGAAEHGAILAAAKANEVDEKYHVAGTVQAKAIDVLTQAKALDCKLGASEKVKDAAVTGAAAAVTAAKATGAGLKDLNEKHSITEKTGAAASGLAKGIGGLIGGAANALSSKSEQPK